MEFDAIVYTSQFGHTKRYAEMLGQIMGKQVLPLDSALSSLPCGSRIVYMGWLHASSIRGYKQAERHGQAADLYADKRAGIGKEPFRTR